MKNLELLISKLEYYKNENPLQVSLENDSMSISHTISTYEVVDVSSRSIRVGNGHLDLIINVNEIEKIYDEFFMNEIQDNEEEFMIYFKNGNKIRIEIMV